MAEANHNVWTPWRMEYIDRLSDRDGPAECFLCRYAADPASDASHHVLWRSPRTLTLLNRFPYTGGHLLVTPTAHQPTLAELDEATVTEMGMRLRDAQRVLQRAFNPQGFNIGMNLGRCAGAGLPDHAHWHIVPRWNGDTNFMSVVGDARLIPISLQTIYDKFISTAREIGI